MKRIALGLGVVLVLVFLVLGALDARSGQNRDRDVGALQQDSDEYLSAVRPHLAISGWTDLQLLGAGQDLCTELDKTNGDVRALFPLVRDLSTASGYDTPAEAAAAQNDYTFIIDASIKWLCPQWAQAYMEQFPTAPPP